ncbi:MAG: Crp/Fnr family transcriptional regulator [Vicinamibacteria bacterium]
MPAAKSTDVVNGLLEMYPSRSRGRVLASCERVPLAFGQILCEPGQPYRYAYFPLNSFISLVASISDHPPLEMGLIGNEGMLGASLALGVGEAPLRGVVQGEGDALRMSAAELQRHLEGSPTFARTVNRYLYVLSEQLNQTAACTRFHEIEPRLARWLLMTHDRAHADHFHLTQNFLAEMLGVMRSAVTIAAGALQRRGLIRYTRGEISIVNRKGLEAAACECYDAVIQDYARLLK